MNHQPSATPSTVHHPATKEQEALQKKEHITDVIQAAQEGKIPTTVQLTDVIEQIQDDDSLHHASANMSSSGRRVMADTENLLDSTKRLLTEKNANDQLQNVIYHTTQSGMAASSGDEISQTKNQLSNTADETKALLSDGADKVARVGWLLVTSSQFRRLMNDVTSIFQELVAGNVSQHPEKEGNASETASSKHTDESVIPHERKASANETDEHIQENLQKSGKLLYEKVKETAQPYVKKAEEGDMPIEDAAKRSVQEMTQGIQQRLKNVRLSSAQEDHLINRVKNVFRELQENPEFQKAVDELSDIASTLKSHGMNAQSLVSEVAQTKNEAGGDDLAIARSNAKELVENFAGNKSLDPLINAVGRLTEEFSQDEELSVFVRDLKEFLHRSILENEFINRPEYKKEVSSFINRGQNIMDRKYRKHFQNISDEASEFNAALQHDRTTQAFARDLEKLTQDIFIDDSGKPTIKYDLVKDFAKLVPVIAKKLEYLPLPRVENSDDQFDIILDNIVLKCSNIAPDYIHLRTDTLLDTNPDNNQNVYNNVHIKFANIQVEAHNMAFYYKKKTFPQMADVGYIDLTMPEEGITIDMTLNTTPAPDLVTGQSHIYEVHDIRTSAKDLKLKIHNSRHDILYKLLSPIINAKVKKIIEEQVPVKVREVMVKIEEQLVKNIETAKAQVNSGSLKYSASQLSKESNPKWGSRAYDLEEPTVQHIREH